MALVSRWAAWFSRPSRIVLFAGGLSALAAVVAVAALALGDFRRTVHANEVHAALLVRILEDHATRTLETTRLALESLSGLAVAGPSGLESRNMESALRQALAGLPFLRGLAVVDAAGRVIASTQAGEVGISVDLVRLGRGALPGRSTVGPLVAGRGLASIRLHGPAEGSPPGVSYLPLLYGFRTPAGEQLMLVALINPDALSNFQHVALESDTFASVITSYDGAVLASSEGAAAVVGAHVADIPVFRQYLPGREQGTYIGAGVLGGRQILGFRVSSSMPLVVIAETPYRDALWRWFEATRAMLGIASILVLMVPLLTFAVWRGALTREAAQRAVDAAQARIARSEHDLSVLMRSVQELIFRTDVRGFITYVNAHWTAFSGEQVGNAIGKDLREFVSLRSQGDVRRALDPGSAEVTRVCQVFVQLGDGRERMFRLAVVPLHSKGRIAGFAGSAVDLTELWIAQQQLQVQISFQNLLLETNPLPISVIDAESRLVQVNRAWEEYKGRSRDTVLGKQLAVVLPPDEAKAHAATNARLLRWGGRAFLEIKILHGDGTRRDTRVATAAIEDEQGRVTGVLSILMDVSEFREAERATREARHAAEESLRAKSEFVANMSHELRTPLQSVLGFAELGVLRGQSQPKLAGMFEDIHSAGKRMLALVNDLLDVSKLESSVGTFHLERVDLRGVVRPVLRELEPLLASNAMQLQVNMSESPLVAKADPLRFQQVIRNVVANAIKFSPPGSTITLEGRMDSKGQPHLVVRDEGPGIPESELETIFEAFVQSSKTKDGSGGTGLGLAICRKIVEAMGGQIYATNLPEGGAAFHILLPARGERETAPAPLL